MECDLLTTSTTFNEVPNGSSKVSIHHPLGVYLCLSNGYPIESAGF